MELDRLAAIGTRWYYWSTNPETQNAQRHRVQTDRQTDRRTDNMMMPIADYTVHQYDRLKMRI